MVTQLSYAKSGKLGSSSGLMFCGVTPPRMCWVKMVVVDTVKGVF